MRTDVAAALSLFALEPGSLADTMAFAHLARREGYQGCPLYLLPAEGPERRPPTSLPACLTDTFDCQLIPDAPGYDFASWNNQVQRPALALLERLKHTPCETLISSLRGGASLHVQNAKAAGLPFAPKDIALTLHTPQALVLPARLELPRTLEEVVLCRNELAALRHEPRLLTTDETALPGALDALLRPETWLSLTPVSPSVRPGLISGKTLTFIGAPNYADGFDIFLDTALWLFEAKKVETVQIFLTETPRLNAKYREMLGWVQGVCETTLEVFGSVEDLEALVPRRVGLRLHPSRHPGPMLLPDTMHTVRSVGHLPVRDTNGDIAYPAAAEAKVRQEAYRAFGGDARNAPETVEIASPVPMTQDPPRVSVIIAHHSRSDLIVDAIASIPDTPDMEIIISDDGSAGRHIDRLKTLVETSNRPNFTLLLGRNAYPGAARNRGVAIARGEYLLFLDDDDWLLPDAMETLLHAAQTSCADIVIPFFETKEAPDAPPTDGYAFLGAGTDSGLFHNLMGGATILIRRTAFLRLGGYTEAYGVGKEDYALLARAQASGLSALVCPIPLFAYRQHASRIRQNHADWNQGSVMQDGFWRVLRERAAVSGECVFELAYARMLHEQARYQYVPEDGSLMRESLDFVKHRILRRIARRIPGLRDRNRKGRVTRR